MIPSDRHTIYHKSLDKFELYKDNINTMTEWYGIDHISFHSLDRDGDHEWYLFNMTSEGIKLAPSLPSHHYDVNSSGNLLIIGVDVI